MTRWLLHLVLLLPAACALPATPPPIGADEVFVIERSWHTDIALPASELAPPLRSLLDDAPGARVLSFGFGERQFLLSRRTTVGGMLTALLPSDSALLMTALSTTPQQAFGASKVVTLHVPHDSTLAIEAAIWRELEKDGFGAPRRIAAGPYPGSVFYAATGTYDGLHTCNSWTMAVLRAGGLPVADTLVLFSGQAMAQARQLAARQDSVRGGG